MIPTHPIKGPKRRDPQKDPGRPSKPTKPYKVPAEMPIKKGPQKDPYPKLDEQE